MSNVAMVVAGRVGEPAREVAAKIAERVEGASVAGPGFVNIRVAGKVMKNWLDEAWHEGYGESCGGAGKVAIVEFPSPNVAKPYSVGHLRPGNQGWAAAALLRATGWRVITDNHLGDSGTPFGVWAVGYLRSGKREVTVYELGEIYVEMKRLLKEGDEGLAGEVQEWLLRLERGDAEAVRLAEMFNEVSLGHIHEVMGRLGIRTDYELGERFFVGMGKELVGEYVERGEFVRNEDGSVVCELPGIEVPMLVLKSNGAALYATTDLACMVYRAREFGPDKVVYCVGAEQKFYFEQLFAMGKKLGLAQENYHLWFGTIDQMVDGRREKMSSRKGVVLMEELLDRAEERARGIMEGREVSDEDVRRVAVGAVKFTDFVADRRTGILFDWDKIFALSGYSGPFVQYAAVRANKIIEGCRDYEAVDYSSYDFEAERGVVKLLLEYPEVVAVAARGLEAHRVAGYVFRLAQEFNRYYEAVPVMRAGGVERSARVDVLRKVAQVFRHGLGILGVEVPGRM
jgi:arginyl-tRNA synthetase